MSLMLLGPVRLCLERGNAARGALGGRRRATENARRRPPEGRDRKASLTQRAYTTTFVYNSIVNLT